MKIRVIEYLTLGQWAPLKVADGRAACAREANAGHSLMLSSKYK
jgi:hypothetical protein